MKKRISNEKGFTLIEVLITGLIMTVMTLAVAEITLATVKAMMHGARQSFAQSSAEAALNQMASDLRSAGANDLEHLINGSGGSAIMIRMFGRNDDALDASSTDLNDDIVCYRFRPPNGSNQFDSTYIPGNLTVGSMSGDPSESACSNWFPMTDKYTDIRAFNIEFCRPDDSDVGAYECTSSTIQNGNLLSYQNDTPNVDISQTSACVWMVKLSVTYSKMHLDYNSQIDSTLYNNSVNTYQTAVMLRNPYVMSLFKDMDDDGRVDCCDPTYGMADADWCPEPQSS